jgi:hypothetical protein
MTKQEAKELSLEVWRYLADHPEIGDKFDLPTSILGKIVDLVYDCPLCELFHNPDIFCPGCPLSGENYYCCTLGEAYERWWAERIFNSKPGIAEAAQEIVRRIEAWEVEEA